MQSEDAKNAQSDIWDNQSQEESGNGFDFGTNQKSLKIGVKRSTYSN